MRESISYTFLLNIVIIFVFTCFAIVMGILSYYKAFRANTIISETIEKYEGYNCVSAEEIARKLGNISYNTPFNVNCNGKGENCMTDTAQNYAVVSYNLDEGFSDAKIIFDKPTSSDEYKKMNSTYKCETIDGKNYCTTNKHYQYGIYTYMYVELPVISSLIRIPFYSKTSIMYEFRNFYVNKGYADDDGTTIETTYYTDIESLYNNLYSKERINNKIYVKDNNEGYHNKECVPGLTGSKCLLGNIIQHEYTNASTSKGGRSLQEIALFITGEPYIDYRTRLVTLKIFEPGRDIGMAGTRINMGQINDCGYKPDYSTID